MKGKRSIKLLWKWCSHYFLLPLLVFSSMLLSGCDGKNTSTQSTNVKNPQNELKSHVTKSIPPVVGEQIGANKSKKSHKSKPVIISTGHRDSSSNSTKPTQSSTKPLTTKSGEQKSQITTSSHKLPLQLMGFSIGGKQSDVVKKFGDPNSQYIMNSSKIPFPVYQYSGFSFGFDQHNKIKFIIVDLQSVDPELHGLYIGDKVTKAIKDLGKPTTNTGYLLKYQDGNSMLRLDIDPKQLVVLSIRLFSLSQH